MTEPSAIPRSRNTLKKNDFDRVFNEGHTSHGKSVVIKFSKNSLNIKRLGLVVKKTGTAVERNYKKRLIREAFRLTGKELPVGYDYVVIVRKNLPMDFKMISDDFLKAIQKVEKCAGS